MVDWATGVILLPRGEELAVVLAVVGSGAGGRGVARGWF